MNSSRNSSGSMWMASRPGRNEAMPADDDQQNRQGQRCPANERAADGDRQQKEQGEFDDGHG
jgi:hypothetical protein